MPQGELPKEISTATWSSARAGADTLDIPAAEIDPSQPLMIAVMANTATTFTLSVTGGSQGPPVTALLAGLPQRADLASGEWGRFRFTTDNSRNDSLGVIFAVTPVVGDPDLYVNIGFPTTPSWPDPNPSGATWKAEAVGADRLEITADDPKSCRAHLQEPCEATAAALGGFDAHQACSKCVFYISVRAFTATSFTITAFAEANTINTVLLEGTPAVSSVETHMYSFFDYEMSELGKDVDVVLTSLSGDADLFASFLNRHPSNLADGHQWFSSSTGNVDRLVISKHDDHYPTALPATLHIAVRGYSAASFTLVASQREDSSSVTVTRLVAGLPQSGALASGDESFYRYTLGNTTEPLGVSFAITSHGTGDPDIYVSTSSDVRK